MAAHIDARFDSGEWNDYQSYHTAHTVDDEEAD